jgi:hypothetical protein
VVLYYPVLRQGFIVSAGRQYKREAAEAIAARLADESPAMLDAIAVSLEQDPTRRANGASLGAAKKRPASLRPSPTLVVDFPAFRARLARFKVELRSCVTVCVDHKQSKIWTRANLLSPDVREAEVNDLFNTFEKAACDVNEGILAEYRRVLREMSEESVSLTKAYELSVRTVSHGKAFVEDYIDEVFGAGNFNGVDDDLKKKVAKAIKSIDSRFADMPGVTTEDTKENAQRRQIGFVGIRSPLTSDSGFPLHQVRLVYAMEYDDQKAKMAGFGFDPYLRDVKPNTSLSHVASANVATEYGGLF